MRKRKLCQLTGATSEEIAQFFMDLKAYELTRRIWRNIEQYANLPLGTMLTPLKAPILYVVCRARMPDVVIETGVASGVSSAFILAALEHNRKGRLYSIDLPKPSSEVVLPEGKEYGWVIPSELKDRWSLTIGKSQEVLKHLLREVGVDVFLHDSEHTYETMMFEFRIAWSYIKEGDIMLSDDVNANKAFQDFVKSVKPAKVVTFGGLGAIRK